MNTFTCFSKLPAEIQLKIWTEAIPTSPGINFLRFPNEKSDGHDDGDNSTRPWKSETMTLRTGADAPSNSIPEEQRQWGRFSSYLSGAALLQTCSASRKVYIENRKRVYEEDASNRKKYDAKQGDTLVKLGMHHVIDLFNDLVVLQESDKMFPYHMPRHLVIDPPLRPALLAIEYRKNIWQPDGAGAPNLPSNKHTQLGIRWLPRLLQYTVLRRHRSEEPLTSESINLEILAKIFLIDYCILPKMTAAPSSSSSAGDHNNLPTRIEHNGAFRGRSATFYSICPEDRVVMDFWQVEKGVRHFRDQMQDTSNWSMLVNMMGMRRMSLGDPAPPGHPVHLMACFTDSAFEQRPDLEKANNEGRPCKCFEAWEAQQEDAVLSGWP